MFIISTAISPVLLQILTRVQTYLFGAVVAVSRDISVEIFPAPVGFTLWILSIGFIALGLQSYIKFVSLRQRIEELEDHLDNN